MCWHTGGKRSNLLLHLFSVYLFSNYMGLHMCSVVWKVKLWTQLVIYNRRWHTLQKKKNNYQGRLHKNSQHAPFLRRAINISAEQRDAIRQWFLLWEEGLLPFCWPLFIAVSVSRQNHKSTGKQVGLWGKNLKKKTNKTEQKPNQFANQNYPNLKTIFISWRVVTVPLQCQFKLVEKCSTKTKMFMQHTQLAADV